MCHTVKDSDVPQESPTAMVTGQRGCVPRTLRLPWLPFWKLSSEFRALKKILLNLSSLCPKQAVFALRTLRICLLLELGRMAVTWVCLGRWLETLESHPGLLRPTWNLPEGRLMTEWPA